MEVTPTSSTSKRPRAKAVAKAPAAAKPARKTLSATRKKSTDAIETVPAPAADLHSMIETAAFYLAAERSFAPGHELDDWLEAERRIKAQA